MDLMFGVHQHLMVKSSPCSNGIFTKEWVLSLQRIKTVIIDGSLQNTLGEKKCQESFGNFLISLPTGTAIILSFMKLLIFLINIPFEHGEDVTIRRWWTLNIRSIHRMLNFMFKCMNIYFKKIAVFCKA